MDDTATYLASAGLNPDPRTPCVLLLDTSSSMGERLSAGGGTIVPINELNTSLGQFLGELRGHAKARASVELAALTFGGRPRLAQDWAPIDGCSFPNFPANGDTPLGEALMQGLELVRNRAEHYRRQKLLCHRPWVVVLTDGQPTDPDHVYEQAAAAAKRAEKDKDATVFVFSVDRRPETIARLTKITDRVQILLDANFPALFDFLSKSLRKISSARSVAAQKNVDPPDPKHIRPWYEDV